MCALARQDGPAPVIVTTIPLVGAMGANIAHVAMCAFWLIALNLVYHKALKDSPDAGLKPAPLKEAID